MPDAQARAPGGHDRVVWLDADIVINPDAPPITDGVPIEKIGAMDESVFPSIEENHTYWNLVAAEYRDSAPTVELCRAALSAPDWHAFWGSSAAWRPHRSDRGARAFAGATTGAC
jgi:hypothetical protein